MTDPDIDILPKVVRFDLEEMGLLPLRWKKQIEEVVLTHAKTAVLTGESETSREESPTNIVYRLVDGEVVRAHLAWLDHLYRTDLTGLATKVAGEPMVPSSDIRNGVNINVLDSRGSRYEWHVDSNPLTGLLFVTSHDAMDGGELIFRAGDQQLIERPTSGHFLLFDARRSPHRVAPMRREVMRISIPINFFREGEEEDRPPDLDSYLYS